MVLGGKGDKAMQDTIKIGALIRMYERDSGQAAAVVEKISSAIGQLIHIGVPDVQVVVWAERDNPAADCGQTFAAMKERFAGESRVHVYEVVEGDLFVDALNQGVVCQRERGITHSLTLSWEAVSAVDGPLLEKMRAAVEDGALVVGVALPELAKFIERGAVMNTCALWNIEALHAVGGFDKRDSKPREVDHYSSSNAGIGEFLPMLKMVERFGRPALAVIRPNKKSTIDVPPERQELQRKKIESKGRRIDGMLAETGYSWSDLQAAILPGYPK